MKIPVKYKDMVKLFEKDIEMKGYNLILNDGYAFLDDSVTEYVENQKELNDFLSMVKKIDEVKELSNEDFKDILLNHGIDYKEYIHGYHKYFTFKHNGYDFLYRKGFYKGTEDINFWTLEKVGSQGKLKVNDEESIELKGKTVKDIEAFIGFKYYSFNEVVGKIVKAINK
jgi:hypothetical protein